MSSLSFKGRRADALRQAAAALDASEETVTVELSLPVAWLLRDLIGLQRLSERARIYGHVTTVPMRDDMVRLNAALPGGHRVDDRPHVSGWSKLAAARVVGRDLP